MKVNEMAKLLKSDGVRILMTRLYGEDRVEADVKRYRDLLAGYKKVSSREGNMMLFSSPSRTEISGNYTDHNHDKVLTDSISPDCVNVAGKNEFSQVHTVNETYNQDFTIDLNHLESNEKRAGIVDLVKGLLQGFEGSGYSVGNLSAYITSNVVSAAEVSSSASFEMLLCSMLNTPFNENHMGTVVYAHIGKLAESNYWDKVSGLLGQMAYAVDGLIAIDFMEPLIPKVGKTDFGFDSQDCSLTIVQTGKGHADLGADYSAVPAETKRVTRYFGKEILSQVSEEQVIDNLAEVRQLAGDQSVLGVLHSFEENKGMEAKVLALKESRFQNSLTNIMASDSSSWEWLQNCSINSSYQEQGITVTLALTELFIAEKQRGVCRIHKEDSAGVIMVVLPNELVDELIHYIEKCTEEGNAYRTDIRPRGAICFDDLIQLCSVFSA